MSNAIILDDRAIGEAHPLYIIAEAGVNHNGKVDRALNLVDVAKQSGADAIKFQLFQVEEQISKYAKNIRVSKKSYG